MGLLWVFFTIFTVLLERIGEGNEIETRNGVTRISARFFVTGMKEEKEEELIESDFSEKSTLKRGKKKHIPMFRATVMRLRKLTTTLKRWEHREKLREGEPDGCGFPVCIVLENRVRRFKSLCHLFQFMNMESLQKTSIHVQKGACEDAIEGKRYEDPWGTVPKNCDKCEKDKNGCAQEVCINTDGRARTYPNVCEAMKHLADMTNLIKIAVGLGNCKALYSKCLFTDWMDLEEPCHRGDYEDYEGVKRIAIETGKIAQGICPRSFIDGPMQGVTLDGLDRPENISFQINQEQYSLQCVNDVQPERAKPPYYWINEEVRCRDFKIRFCCKLMYGTAIALTNRADETDVLVDAPHGKTLFDECEWRGFISEDYGDKLGDIETRVIHARTRKQSACGSTTRHYAMIIDARTRNDDVPADETGEIITKQTPWFGFYCDNKNNKIFGKTCSDYKIRYCCTKLAIEPAQWADWSPYSECSKSCGVGKQSRTRVCNRKRGNKANCKGIGVRSYSYQERECNVLPCPTDLQWGLWTSWSSCSATCGSGTSYRRRACTPPRNKGKECPEPGDKGYKETKSCIIKNCPDPQWVRWSDWSECSKTCGSGLREKTRFCLDKANNGLILEDPDACLGPKKHNEMCFERYCPIDGGFSVWQGWGECDRGCGEGGKRKRKRYCVAPFPVNGGKECEGKDTEIGPCEKLRPCPVHCRFSEWGGWSDCSVSCGNGPSVGKMTRNRHIEIPAKYGGIKCDNITEEAKICVHCNVSKDIKPDELCKCIPFCPVNCEWSEWQMTHKTCKPCWKDLPGFSEKEFAKHLSKTRIRTVSIPPRHGGAECKMSNGSLRPKFTFEEIVREPCTVSDEVAPAEPPPFGSKIQEVDTPKCADNREKEIYFGDWSEWSMCTAVCGTEGMQKRVRNCIGGTVSDCEESEKAKGVQTRPCPSLCMPPQWSEWEDWSKCEVTCGRGQIARRRTCLADAQKMKTTSPVDCEGIQRQQKRCDKGPCDSLEKIAFEGIDKTGMAGQQLSSSSTTSTSTKSSNRTRRDKASSDSDYAYKDYYYSLESLK